MKRREQRLGKVIKQEISTLLERKVNDPRLKDLVSVTEVQLSSDLRQAKVFVSILGSESDKKEMIAGFNSACSFLQGQLSLHLKLKHTPQLSFHYDDSIERGAKLLKLIEQASDE
jgi:ribosome-binding factor A